jgi:hypothetical protein
MTKQDAENLRATLLLELIKDDPFGDVTKLFYDIMEASMKALELKSCTFEFIPKEKGLVFQLGNITLADNYTEDLGEFKTKFQPKEK